MPQFLNFILLSNYFLSKSTDWQVRAAPGDHDRGWAVWLARLPPTGGGLCNGSWRWCSCDKGTICPQVALAKHSFSAGGLRVLRTTQARIFCSPFQFQGLVILFISAVFDVWCHASVCIFELRRKLRFEFWSDSVFVSMPGRRFWFSFLKWFSVCFQWEAGDFDFHF